MAELAMNIASTALLLLLCGILALILIKIRNIIDAFYTFLASPAENEPSELAKLIQTMGHAAGHAAAIEAKTTAMGRASGEARLEQAIKSDIAQDTLQAENPLLAGLFDMYPSLKKRALKNPGVTDFLLSKLAGTVGTPGNGKQLSSPRGEDYATRLNRYS